MTELVIKTTTMQQESASVVLGTTAVSEDNHNKFGVVWLGSKTERTQYIKREDIPPLINFLQEVFDNTKPAPVKVGDVITKANDLPQRMGSVVIHTDEFVNADYTRNVFVRTGANGWMQAGIHEYLGNDHLPFPVQVIFLPQNN